ncbi:MAG: AsmA family protein [Beijerinckiaceae bacterium]|nr:AsmA family protein [Beijerinckiaceae bacterium]
MSRRRRLAGLGAGMLAVAALLAPWQMAERSVERYLLSELSRKLGVSISSNGTGALAILPLPRIIANEVMVASPDGTFKVRVPRLRADVRLLSLVGGRLEFDHVILHGPHVDVVLPEGGIDPLDLARSQLAAALPAMPHISVRSNGAVFFRRGPGIVSSVRDVNIEISARARGEAVEVEGSSVWRGERLSFAFASNSPERATLPMARIRSDLVNLDFASRRSAGTSAEERGQLEGPLQISAASMSRLGSWLASGSPVLLPLGRTALDGTLKLTASGAQISDATLTLGQDPLTGAMDWRARDGRWRLTGTFAGRSLDIGRPQSGIDARLFDMPDPSWSALLDVDGLLAHDIDLRLSLQRVRLPGLVLTDVAGQILGTDQRLDVTVAKADLYRGTMRGRASVGRSDNGIEVRSQLVADKVDLALLSQDLLETRRMSGIGTLQYQVEGSGRTVADLTARTRGKISFGARNGDFLGTNLTDAMRRLERQPLAVMRDWRGGRTGFEQIALSGTIEDGVLDVTEARANGPGYRLALEGKVSLTERLYRLSGNVQSATGGAQVPFDVVGPLTDPSVQVNLKAIIDRTGTTGPLSSRQPN